MEAAIAQEQGNKISTSTLIGIATKLQEDVVTQIQSFDLESQVEFFQILSAMSLMSGLSVRLETIMEEKFGKHLTDIFHLLERDRSSFRGFINSFWETYEETCHECGASNAIIEMVRKHRGLLVA